MVSSFGLCKGRFLQKAFWPAEVTLKADAIVLVGSFGSGTGPRVRGFCEDSKRVSKRIGRIKRSRDIRGAIAYRTGRRRTHRTVNRRYRGKDIVIYSNTRRPLRLDVGVAAPE